MLPNCPRRYHVVVLAILCVVIRTQLSGNGVAVLPPLQYTNEDKFHAYLLQKRSGAAERSKLSRNPGVPIAFFDWIADRQRAPVRRKAGAVGLVENPSSSTHVLEKPTICGRTT